MLTSKYRYLIPNSITFLSLACGIVSILASATGYLVLGGALVLTSYILDLFDGGLARRLNASSEFGLQLDSLVDMVSLGVAPATLAFFHLQAEGINMVWVWPLVVLLPLGGAFRLARFNLLPPKTGSSDSVGLTISTGGATLALAILSDIALTGEAIPDFLYIPFMVGIFFLMVSRIAFPPLSWAISRRSVNVFYVAFIISSLTWMRLPAVNTWFILTSGYLGAGLARASYKAWGGE